MKMTLLKRLCLTVASICLGASGAWAYLVESTVIPSNGPSAGGNVIVVTNVSVPIGNGSDITNVIINLPISFRTPPISTSTTNILGQGTNWVRFVAPAAVSAGLKFIYTQAVSEGLRAAGFYTYNPAGEIGHESCSEWINLAEGIGGEYGDRIFALAENTNGNLYAGGSFRSAGGVAATNIAEWNGTTWTSLGSGMKSYVNTLALDTNGNLYAGGAFTNAGGVAANRIAKWNGTTWTSLDSGLGLNVSALTLDMNGNLYAGGSFTNAGAVAAKYIAKWDGTTWTSLESGLGWAVYALTSDTNGNLYAGGMFTNAGGVAANYIAKWDGTTWTSLGAGMNTWVFTLALDTDGNLYAGGDFTNAGGMAANHVAKWDGTTWTNLGDGINARVRALALDTDGNLYAGGDFTNAGGVAANYITKWNGTTWTNLGDGMTGVADYGISVSALALDANKNLYAGGSFTNAGGVEATNIAKWFETPADFGVSPTSCPIAGGVTVTISGTNLCNGMIDDVTNVMLCSVTAAVTAVAGSTQIVVTAGQAAAGSLGNVEVYSTSFGVTIKSNAFTYVGSVETNLPTPVVATVTYGTYTNIVRVTWFGVTGATSYAVLRNTTNDANGATILADVPAEAALVLSRTASATTYYYDDYAVVGRQSYYYWVRAISSSGISALSYVGVGYAELGSGQTVGRADMTVSDMVFLPVNLTNGTPAGTVSYRLANGGPDTLTAAPVRFDFYMIQGDQEAWMTFNETNVTLAAGAEQLYILDALARQEMLVRGDLAGQYAVQARVRHLDLTGDQHTGSNTTDASGTVLVRDSGVNSPGRSFNDYDGDGKADGPIYRSSDGRWYTALSGYRYQVWLAAEAGLAGLTPVPGDYDGDGITDMATYNHLNGWWTALLSSTEQTISGQLGGPGFTAIQCDFDGDAITDPVVYRETDGYWMGAASSREYISYYASLGETGYQPVMADYDGDGLADPAVYNRTTGLWGIAFSSSGYQLITGSFGGTGYLPVNADYDGDGLADPAIYASSTGYWQVLMSGTFSTKGYYTWWGGFAGSINGIPLPADYDGDGKADVAVYHQATGIWELFLSANGYQLVWGGFGGPEYQPATE